MGASKIENIIVADSQFLVVETLKKVIGEDERFLLAGVASSRYDLFKLLEKTKSGLLITDIETIDYDGLDDLKIIKDEYPQIKLLVLTHSVSKSEFLTLTKLGIRNIVYKNADKEELWSAIRATLKNKKYFSEEIIDLYLEINENRHLVEEPRTLTPSEIEIVRMIANGLTTKDIASRRNISSHTVSTHRKNIFKKIGVTSASELIIHAIKAGWIDNIEYYI